jgi:hypothetical protein
VFVVGSPRSGTTALALALAEHSELWGFDESQFLWDLFGSGIVDKNYRRVNGSGSWLERQGIGRQKFLEHLGLGINAMMTALSGGLRWVDQTPIYSLLVDQLADMFPGARFIHICRDGRSTVHSMVNYGRRFPEAGGALAPWATNFREACRTWRRYVEAVLDFERTSPGRCLTVANETLSEDAASGFEAIMGFLKLPKENGPAEFFRTNRVNSSFDAASGAAPRDADVIWGQWHPNRRAAFLEEVGELPARCGYEIPTRPDPAQPE